MLHLTVSIMRYLSFLFAAVNLYAVIFFAHHTGRQDNQNQKTHKDYQNFIFHEHFPSPYFPEI